MKINEYVPITIQLLKEFEQDALLVDLNMSFEEWDKTFKMWDEQLKLVIKEN